MPIWSLARTEEHAAMPHFAPACPRANQPPMQDAAAHGTTGGSRWRKAAALIAAYVLLLQMVLVGLSLGAHADPARLDSFGNVLCATGQPGSPATPADDPAHHTDCCFAFCQNVGTAAVATPDITVPARLAPASVKTLESQHIPALETALATPWQARAPPRIG